MSTQALREQIRLQVRTAWGANNATGSDESIAALMRQFEAGYEAANAAAIVACFAPDIEWSLPDSRVLRGRPACLAFLKERFASPAGPRFSDSRMNVLGLTVVQHYTVSLPLPGGQTGRFDGTDVYQVRNGLIARKDAYWKQIGAPKAGALVAAGTLGAAALVVPLRVGAPAQAAALTELFKRLAASPALLQAAQSGVLRFDLIVDEGAAQTVASAGGGASSTSAMAATTAIDPAACCAPCREGKACECGDTHDKTHCDTRPHGAPVVTQLKGVIGERQVKALAPATQTIRLHPKAVLTPLGKDALRRRGIAIDRGTKP